MTTGPTTCPELPQRRGEILTGVALFGLALLVRLPYLGDYMTIDEIKWLEGTGQFLLGVQKAAFAETYWHFHPGITITWGEAIILWFQYLFSNSPDLTTFVTAQVAELAQMVGPMRLSPVIITSLAVAGMYWLARPLVGHWPALLGAGLLAADPFFVAHSRIVNGDAGTAALMILTFLAFAQLWQKHNWRMVILAGVLAGLTLLTKLPSPIILVWLVIQAGIGYIKDRQERFWLGALLVSGGIAAATFIVLWPSMWVAPLGTLRLMFNDSFDVGGIGAGHETFFLGQIGDDPGWFFYPYVITFRLTPLTIIGVVAGLLWLWRNRASSVKLLLARILLLYIIIVYLFANISPKKLDRYVISVVPAIILLAGIGLAWLVGWLANVAAERCQIKQQYIFIIAAIGIIALQTSFVIANYPYVLTYYNPLMGSYPNAARQVPVGWGEGLEQAAAWINAQPNASELLVSSWYNDLVQPYLESAKTISFSSSGKDQLTADYVIFYINQSQRQKPNQAIYNYFIQREPVFQVEHQDTSFVWVYPGPRMQVEVSGKVEIEGRAQLLGYSWEPEVPQKPGSTADLRLFMYTKGDLPANETFEVLLAAADGTLWGNWQSLDKIDWQPEAIVEWQGTLALTANMPPGGYELVVQLIDLNIDSEVTRFPLEGEIVSLNE